MDAKVKIFLKVAAGLAAVVVLAYGAYVAYGNLSGSRFEPGGDAGSSPVALTSWLIRGVSVDKPATMWNAMTDGYRAQFGKYFERVRKGEVPVKPWEEAGRKSGLASTPEALNALPDQAMFEVYWNLVDRAATGIAAPLFFRSDARKAESTIVLKVFYDTRDAESAKEAFVLFQVDGISDVLHTTRVDGMWRLDVPEDIPGDI